MIKTVLPVDKNVIFISEMQHVQMQPEWIEQLIIHHQFQHSLTELSQAINTA